MLKLSAKPREAGKALGTTREEGSVPAIVYGPERDSTSIGVGASEFGRLYKAAGASTLVELEVESEKDSVIVVIRDIQRHPVKGHFMHVDFMAVKMGEEMNVAVPLTFVGVAPIEKSGVGVVVTEVRDLEISALPQNLPSGIEVDISVLVETHSAITIADLNMPEGVTAIGDPEQIVVHGTSLMAEEEEVGAPEGDEIPEDSKDDTKEGDADAKEDDTDKSKDGADDES